MDLHSISVDVNDYPIVEIQPSHSLIQLETINYSKLLRKVAGINVVSLPCTIICIIIDLIATFIILGMGASYQSSCPIEPRIPIYLIVFGSINLISICFSIISIIIHYRQDDKNLIGFYFVHCSAIIIIILQLFNYIWLIIGSIWIFRIFQTVQYTEIDQTIYCQENLYQFSMVSTILQYALSFVLCGCKNLRWNF
ncbi:unnamed protein product [Rotaria sordida]|uniref:Transmembrane protein n=1 Tax=Rotaria sordida TaxID=392033 RepID=A0A815C371_9BILA|nr:unnamed protein product [Rotaria sordida]CAF1204898.1 unnamed protein product [Rotaria sordida]CAF1278214.1 unnamed protein product [Rotaria sordida]CAF3662692.1 unnamed protein product [Rotaria sordida]CAF3773179.1 unnamed protein product [Rotaria sordida]